MGVVDQSCILINIERNPEDKGIIAIQDNSRITGDSYIDEINQIFDTNYMNWLVGNGFVIIPGFGNPKTDAQAIKRLKHYFPNRDVYLIEMLSSWVAGGGVHCHTNDQPAFSISK